METYEMIVQEFDNQATESNRLFEKRLDLSESRRCQGRSVHLAKVVLTLLTESKNRDNAVPKPLTVRNWWDIFSRENYPKKICMKYLKCSRKTYIYLARVLGPWIRTQIDATLRKARVNTFRDMRGKKMIAIMLHKLARKADYPTLSGMFGIHKSTIRKIIHSTIAVASEHLLHNVISMPKRKEALRVAHDFEDTSMVPQLLGALETTHVRICTTDKAIFKNSKNYHSYAMQTIVDANCCFRDVSVRHSGSANDRRILEDSLIYKLHERVLPSDTRIIENHEIPYKIVASSSYPLLAWLLTEYEEAMTSSECHFNDRLTIARLRSNVALARLKGRFEIISRGIDVNLRIAPRIIAVCCAIHNICEKNEDPCPDKWLNESRREDIKFPQPERIRDERTPKRRDVELRDAIRDHLERKLTLEGSVGIDRKCTR